MLTASRSSIRIARSYCWKASAVGWRDRQVHAASFAQPVRLPITFHFHKDQRHFQWRFYSSKVKSMPEKQLKGKEEAAAAGQDDPAAHYHYDKVADVLGKDSVERMGNALSIVQEALAKLAVRSPSHNERESNERQLKITCEESKVAVRHVRRQVMQKIGRLARDGDISHDDQDRMADTIQDLTDNYVDQIEDMIKNKRTNTRCN